MRWCGAMVVWRNRHIRQTLPVSPKNMVPTFQTRRNLSTSLHSSPQNRIHFLLVWLLRRWTLGLLILKWENIVKTFPWERKLLRLKIIKLSTVVRLSRWCQLIVMTTRQYFMFDGSYNQHTFTSSSISDSSTPASSGSLTRSNATAAAGTNGAPATEKLKINRNRTKNILRWLTTKLFYRTKIDYYGLYVKIILL